MIETISIKDYIKPILLTFVFLVLCATVTISEAYFRGIPDRDPGKNGRCFVDDRGKMHCPDESDYNEERERARSKVEGLDD